MSDTIFSRNLGVWGEEKQQQLAESCVLVAGVGGLGSTVSQMLLRSGVGKLILLDNGVLDEPDLNRQILYTQEDLGREKVVAAAEKLSSIYPKCVIIPIKQRLTETPSLFNTLRQHAFQGIADCFDNFSSRFILERLLPEDTFLVHGGVQGDYGQITTIKPGVTKRLHEIFPNVEDSTSPLSVCPPIVTCIGSLMAHEVLKNLWNIPQLLNTLLIVELSDFSFFKVQLR